MQSHTDENYKFTTSKLNKTTPVSFRYGHD